MNLPSIVIAFKEASIFPFLTKIRLSPGEQFENKTSAPPLQFLIRFLPGASQRTYLQTSAPRTAVQRQSAGNEADIIILRQLWTIKESDNTSYFRSSFSLVRAPIVSGHHLNT